MCKAYGCKPSVDLFRGFFNLCRAGKWLTFDKRSEKHVPNFLLKVITHIEGWHYRFFSVQDSIIPAKYSQFLSEQNKLDTNSFKDKLPLNIEENPIFQRLGRYPMSFRVFLNPILFLAGLKSSWKHGQQRPMILAGGKAARIKDRKCKTRGGSSRSPVKRKLAPGTSTSRATRAKTYSSKDDAPFLTVSDDDDALPDVLELKYVTACHLKISAITPLAWMNHLDNRIDLELLDLYDRCYVIKKLKGEFDVMKSRERAREEECKGLQVKCEAAMTEIEKNPAMVALQEKISALSTESKVTSLEAEKARLEVVKVALRKEVEELKQDRREVVSKVVPYVVMELVHSDDMGSLIGKLVSSVIAYGRCWAFEQASNNLATATFHWLDVFVADPLVPIKALLLKKPLTLQRPAPSRTHVPLPSSQRATPSFVPVSNLMSPPADASIVKPQSSQPH
ncbi:hypothetical protein Tco_1056844 [Tanacetum coccineum]|uniref:Uncharacterized protein n=1 Tax=Tanacetum coccineum TaxID=301880 RepID=A0ABQ5H3Q6_9ASTR